MSNGSLFCPDATWRRRVRRDNGLELPGSFPGRWLFPGHLHELEHHVGPSCPTMVIFEEDQPTTTPLPWHALMQGNPVRVVGDKGEGK